MFIREKSRWALILVIWLSCCTAFGQGHETSQSTTPVLTLDEAVSLALAHNRTVQIANLDVAKFKEQLAETRTNRLPHFSTYLFLSQLLAPISFTFPAGSFDPNSPIGPIPSTDAKITTPSRPTAYTLLQAAQPLSQLWKIHLATKAQELSVDLSKQKLRGTRQEIVANVRQAYYAVLQSESALESTEAAVKQYKELDRLMVERISQQAVLKSDTLEVKAKLAQQEFKIVQLNDTLQDQKEQLNSLLGRNLNTAFETEQVPAIRPMEMDIKDAQHMALKQRPEVKQAEITVEQADYGRRISKAAYIPDVSAAIHYMSPFGVEVVPKNVASAGLEFSWEPFDWGRRKHDVNDKTITLDQSKLQLADVQSKVLMDVDSKFRKLRQSRALLGVAKVAQEASVEKLREVTAQYGQQSVLLRDVLQQQSAVASANDDYENALLSFWSAKAQFEKALGEE